MWSLRFYQRPTALKAYGIREGTGRFSQELAVRRAGAIRVKKKEEKKI